MQIVNRLLPSDINWMIEELEKVKNDLTRDVSNYAKGRQRVWLNGIGEPHLAYPKIMPSIQHLTIDKFIQEKLGIQYDFCLAHFSGDKAIGIKPHRDASFSNRIAFGINLGGCDFSIGEPAKEYRLSGGEIYSFNCKTIHSADPVLNRWGLNLWTAKPLWLAQADSLIAKVD